jgi:hypothetical protein
MKPYKNVKSITINDNQTGLSFDTNIHVPFPVDEIQVKYCVITELDAAAVATITLLKSNLVPGETVLSTGLVPDATSFVMFLHSVFQMPGLPISGQYTFNWVDITGALPIATFSRQISINMLFVEY